MCVKIHWFITAKNHIARKFYLLFTYTIICTHTSGFWNKSYD